MLNGKNIQTIAESGVPCSGGGSQHGMSMHTEYVSYLSKLEHQGRDTSSK